MLFWGLLIARLQGTYRSETGGVFEVDTVTNEAALRHLQMRPIWVPANDNRAAAA